MVSYAAAQLIEQFARAQLPPGSPGRTVPEVRAMAAAMAASQPPATNATLSTVLLGGVPAERALDLDVIADRVVLYLHGGGFITGSPSGQRRFTVALSRATRAEVFAVDYRLAPEHPHPAAVEDAVTSYRAVMAERSHGRPILVGGDSAGGGLTVALLVALRDAGEVLPAAAFAISPWVDLTLTSPTFESHAERDLLVRPADIAMMAQSYLAGGSPVSSPTVSPLFADLHGLPPLLVQVGSEEILVGDAQALATRAAESGVNVLLQVSDGMFHTWPVMAPDLPESLLSMGTLARFVNDQLAIRA